MDAKKRKRHEYESDTVAYLRRGAITVLDALDEQLPDVFAAEILPKLSLEDTLNLAQVSKAYRDSVWSVRGVQSLEAKIKAHNIKNTSHQRKRIREDPMYQATKHGNLRAIRALLQSGVDVNKPLNGNMNWSFKALWFASLKGYAAVVKEFIEAGADVNERGSAKRIDPKKAFSEVTPLYVAAHEGHTPVVIQLIRAGVDVNIPISAGVTPIHVAALKGCEACVAILLQAGADVNKADESARTPLSAAIESKHEKVVKLLKYFGAR